MHAQKDVIEHDFLLLLSFVLLVFLFYFVVALSHFELPLGWIDQPNYLILYLLLFVFIDDVEF